MKNTMTTFTGRHFDPMQIRTEDICIEDIAHALSLMCRGGGHLKYFYSVAQHSLNCSAEAKARGWSGKLQLACLLHDASEAYISDIIRPVKANLTGYLEIESRIMEKILEKFNLSDLTEEERRVLENSLSDGAAPSAEEEAFRRRVREGQQKNEAWVFGGNPFKE